MPPTPDSGFFREISRHFPIARGRSVADACDMPRYRRYFSAGQIVFLTLACNDRTPWFRPPEVRGQVIGALQTVRSWHPFRHYGHVVLEDHLHLLLCPCGATRVPMLVGSFKRAVLSRWRPLHPGERLWQRRYFDHVIRDADDFRRHLDYLHFNPVKHGLVTHAGDWPWSSLSQWVARGVYRCDWGAIPPEDWDHMPWRGGPTSGT